MMWEIIKSQKPKPGKVVLLFCLIGLASVFIAQDLNAQQNYTPVFNPMHGFVNEAEKPFRAELSLNGKWQFMPVFETDMAKFVKPETFRWDSVPLKVPSPWNVNSFSKGDGGDFVVFPSYPAAWERAQMGWMKKEFVLPGKWSGKRIKLHFEAIAGFAKIYVNGKAAGENLDIFFPTELDVTSLLKKGTNEILVGVAKASLTDVRGKYGRRNYVAGSFWGQHIAGIWQDVSLIALPELSISDVFVQPDVRNDELSFSVTIRNNTRMVQTVSLHASVRKWEKPVSSDINLAPVDNGVLKDEALQMDYPEKTELKSGDSIVLTMSKKVTGKLKTWSPESPNLYGAVISLTAGIKKKAGDIKYTRFGWRQFTISGTQFLLNGKSIVMKGDSWHFMGIPEMTRRYAWAWYKMLKDANANAVRLHAQPYPSFFLDVADEMGICVLDETGIWSSDGGPKMDSDDYWVYCRKHVKSLVMRDRNHPSVFGWSVCNETVPVVINVMHAPETIVQRQIDEINNWVKIVRSLDQTRDWISGDGEEMRPTDLPTVIGHYGNEGSMKKWSSEGKPWGVGETGMGYYGTPKQISVINGNRAYESQQGRMEGLATEAYDLIGKQQQYKASYTSVFNIAWYGLKPLEFGLPDTTRSPKPEDGIFFPGYREGIPGVQPERLGPYTSTLNPGYDPNLPLYKPWPLFYAVQAINSTPVKPFKIEGKNSLGEMTPSSEKIEEAGIISGTGSNLPEYLETLGVPFVELSGKKPAGILIIDGKTAEITDATMQLISQCLNAGGKIMVWGVGPDKVESLNKILPFPLKLTNREATSFLVKSADELLAGLGHKDFYFTELSRQPIMNNGLSGEFVKKGTVLVDACNTNWARWNSRPENMKTAAVYRSELEAKPEGAAIVKIGSSKGEIYVNNIAFEKLKAEGEGLTKKLLTNLGIVLKTVPVNSLKALTPEGILERAIILKGIQSADPITMDNQSFVNTYEAAGQLQIARSDPQNFFDLGRDQKVCLSFWVYSPRSLLDLLVEPDMPELNLIVSGSQNVKVSVNGHVFGESGGSSGKIENLPLDKGWNHVLIALERNAEVRGWRTKVSLESNKREFIEQLRSAVGK